jgi:hypothetical protein
LRYLKIHKKPRNSKKLEVFGVLFLQYSADI